MPTTDPVKYRAKRKRYYAKLLKRVVAKLGGKCVECKNDDFRVLQLDHILSLKILKKNRKSKTQILHEAIRLKKELINLQILCANCHMIKTWRP